MTVYMKNRQPDGPKPLPNPHLTWGGFPCHVLHGARLTMRVPRAWGRTPQCISNVSPTLERFGGERETGMVPALASLSTSVDESQRVGNPQLGGRPLGFSYGLVLHIKGLVN